MNKKQKTAHEPNIAFVGTHSGEESVTSISNGDLIIELPADQSAPFYHPNANLICRLLPWLYKPVVRKG